MRATSLILLSLLTLTAAPSSFAGEDVREIQLYQKAQGEKSYQEYLRWKREQERTERYDRADRRPPTGYCKDWYEMEGTKMLTEGLARKSARAAWERRVRVKENEEFADFDFAGGKKIRCWDVGRFTRCEARGRACRPS